MVLTRLYHHAAVSTALRPKANGMFHVAAPDMNWIGQLSPLTG